MRSSSAKEFGITRSLDLLLFLLPLILIALFCFMLLVPPARPIAQLLTNDKGVLDAITVVFLIGCGLMGLRLLLLIGRRQNKRGPFLFCLVFLLGIVSMAVAEVAWSTKSAFVETPPSHEGTDVERETNTHRLSGLQNSLEIFPLAYGLAGLLGIWISRKRHLETLHVPEMLVTWFLVIATLSAIDLSYDFHTRFGKLDRLIGELEEAVEMLVSVSAFLFVWLNTKKLSLVTG